MLPFEISLLHTALEGPRTELCRRVLQICLPWMEAAPEGGWLPYIYECLTRVLYPTDTPCELSPSAALYVQALEAALAAEQAPFDPLTDLLPVPEEAFADSRTAEEYHRFRQAVDACHLMALLRLGREIMPFDTMSHIIGVHNVALQVGILARQAGLPVDLPLVSAACFAHDVGKFGCRGNDAARIPYLHYYYTWIWLEQHGLEEIGHVAANHSTWDLEFENLPIESLLLIYADFRVRGVRAAGREVMGIYTLKESRDMIFSKLADMTPEKKKRYQTVYCKLRDFEQYLQSMGISGQLTQTELLPAERQDPALLTQSEALVALRHMTFDNNIRLMHTITREQSFDHLLEQARGERNAVSIRTYLRILDEYSTYMTDSNKRKTLALLYELLMHADGDVRRRAGEIMGRILCNAGPAYRKELPMHAPKSALAPAVMALLDRNGELWDSYIDQCLYPDRRISVKHALRISNSLKAITESLFRACKPQEAAFYARPLLQRLQTARGEARFYLADALRHVPLQALQASDEVPLLCALLPMLQDAQEALPIAALRLIDHLLPLVSDDEAKSAVPVLLQLTGHSAFAVSYLSRKLLARINPDDCPPAVVDISQLYLSNLKNAVHWMVKLVQVDALCDDAAYAPENAFHTAMHLSNLLSVSEHLPVREHAGRGLLRIADLLTVDQRNEICVDLLRELEGGRDQVSRFIPPFLGSLICTLPEKEMEESIDFLEDLIRAGSESAARAAVYTMGAILSSQQDNPVRTGRTLGLLAAAVAHHREAIHQTGLTALCRDVLGSAQLPLQQRRQDFLLCAKKLLCLLAEPRESRLTVFNRAAMLNHLYRFMTQCELDLGPFPHLPELPVAFFPGTFDPFSTGHRRIVEEIHALGFQVYLAIDEFSWSKRPLAHLQRRKIASLSVANLWDVYLFPDEIPVNIANPQDLRRLTEVFHGREVYLTAGSDVIRNASAYKLDEPGCAAEYNHLLICREGAEDDAPFLRQTIRGKLQLLTLPDFYEKVSSTRIREYMDKNLDISMLVDPMAQSYIYEYGLYLRAPQFKQPMKPQLLSYRLFSADHFPPAVSPYRTGKSPTAVGLYLRQEARPLGWACGHTASPSDLYDVVEDLETASFVRHQASGRILVVDAVVCAEEDDAEICRRLVNELLARSLPEDHTYGLCRLKQPRRPLLEALEQLGFAPIPHRDGLYYVDMREPTILTQDVYLCMKSPHREDPAVRDVVEQCRPLLRRAITQLFPGSLMLTFDTEHLNQTLLEKVQVHNGVQDVPPGVQQLGRHMCVPYGRILSNTLVPNTVTKALHVEKVYTSDISTFTVEETPGFSNLTNQVRTIHSFRRPLLLVDDLLHKGYRLDNLEPVMRAEGVEVACILAALLSGRGNDLMRQHGHRVDCEYFIPNLHYWFNESALYPFLGGDRVGQGRMGQLLPSINMILPYYYPKYMYDAQPQAIRALSKTVLENACAILETLERQHQLTYNEPLVLRRLSEAVDNPRVPDKGHRMQYDLSVPASVYVREDLNLLMRTDPERGGIPWNIV